MLDSHYLSNLLCALSLLISIFNCLQGYYTMNTASNSTAQSDNDPCENWVCEIQQAFWPLKCMRGKSIQSKLRHLKWRVRKTPWDAVELISVVVDAVTIMAFKLRWQNRWKIGVFWNGSLWIYLELLANKEIKFNATWLARGSILLENDRKYISNFQIVEASWWVFATLNGYVSTQPIHINDSAVLCFK